MTVKDPVNYASNRLDIGTKVLDDHSYKCFIHNQTGNTSQDTYVHKTDE